MINNSKHSISALQQKFAASYYISGITSASASNFIAGVHLRAPIIVRKAAYCIQSRIVRLLADAVPYKKQP